MEDILDEHISFEKEYLEAPKNKRLVNFIIDMIVRYALTLILGFSLGVIAAVLGRHDDLMLFFERGGRVLDYTFGLFITLIYYIVFEYFFNGKTIGKMVTKTRAITMDNSSLSMNDVLQRSFSRIIPFEAFTFLGENNVGLHDRLSKTKVVMDEL